MLTFHVRHTIEEVLPQGRHPAVESALDFSAGVNCDFSKETEVSVCLKADVGSTTPDIPCKDLAAFHREKGTRGMPECKCVVHQVARRSGVQTNHHLHAKYFVRE